jgi:hypothetical protein
MRGVEIGPLLLVTFEAFVIADKRNQCGDEYKRQKISHG